MSDQLGQILGTLTGLAQASQTDAHMLKIEMAKISERLSGLISGQDDLKKDVRQVSQDVGIVRSDVGINITKLQEWRSAASRSLDELRRANEEMSDRILLIERDISIMKAAARHGDVVINNQGSRVENATNVSGDVGSLTSIEGSICTTAVGAYVKYPPFKAWVDSWF